MTRVACYERVSTEEQVKKDGSLPEQKERLELWAKLEGWEIVEHYKEQGVSGGTDNRPELQRLMSDAKAGMFDLVAVTKLDRFMRNTRLLLDYVHELDGQGVDFATKAEGIDTRNEGIGKVILALLGAVAEWERDRIGERIKDARQHRASKNQWSCGRTPFGYRFNNETKELVIEPLEAEVIQFMFNHYLNDSLGVKRLAELLIKEQKTTSRLGHRKHNFWTQSAVRFVLTHPAYKGGPNETWQFKCPAIVDLTLWESVQKRLKTNRHFKPTAEHREFQGLLKCGICGHVLRIGYNHNTNPHYECPGRLKSEHLDGSDRCTLPRQQADLLDKSLNTQVSEIFNNPELFNKHVKETIKNLESEVKELERRLKPLQVENDRIKSEMDKADTKFEMGRLDKESYKSIIAELSAKLRGIERQQTEADPMLLKEYKLKLGDLDLCKYYGSDLDYLPPELRESQKQDRIAIIRESTKPSVKIGFSHAIDSLGQPFNSPREVMKKWGMVGYVYPDRIEIKGSLQTGKSVITPDCR